MLQVKQFRKLYLAVLILGLISLTGVLGFVTIEDYSFGDALYMTIITISTVGYQEVAPLSEVGQYFTIFLIVTSFGTFAYALSSISSYLIDGEFRKHLSELKKIKELENHIIVCGYGRNGKQIVQELHKSVQDFVLIEKDEHIIEQMKQEGEKNFYEGDATDDQVLINAGIKKAKALITTLPEDADNVFVVLTAREMNPDLLIISRASKDTTDKKLRMAGADNVVMPDKVGGSHMASLVIKPDVVEFFNHLSGQDNNISLEEISYESLPKEFKDKSIGDLHVRRRSGANIVGLKTEEAEFVLNPSPDTIITEGTKLFVLGMKNQVEDLKKWE